MGKFIRYRKRKNNNFPDRHGYTWLTGEFDDLKVELDLNLSLNEIANNHKRTIHAIQCAIVYKFPNYYYVDKNNLSDIIINNKNYSDKLNKIIQIINLKVDIL